MISKYPAGTTSIRNLTQKYNYFLVVKPDDLVDDIPQIEYFVYRFKVPVSASDGINSLKKYFAGIELIKCQPLTDIEYATGDFLHPNYLNQEKKPLAFKLREIPIYFQSKSRIIDLKKDIYRYGSKPIIKDKTSPIIENPLQRRIDGKIIK